MYERTALVANIARIKELHSIDNNLYYIFHNVINVLYHNFEKEVKVTPKFIGPRKLAIGERET